MAEEPNATRRPRRAAAAAALTRRPDHGARALSLLQQGKRVIVLSGSGISVSAGLATFSSSKSGLYGKAAEKFGLKQGSDVFRYSFFESRPDDCFRFLEGLYRKAAKALPTPTHNILKKLGDDSKRPLIRHYTMNIDGLASQAGASLWNKALGSENADPTAGGKTVELHGSLHQLLCSTCGADYDTSDKLGKKKAADIPACGQCEKSLRFRVLLYDDKERDLVTRVDPFESILAEDMVFCEMILVVGISFEQAASCEHFRKVWVARNAAMKRKDTGQIPVFLIDPNAAHALENLQSVIGENEGVYTVQSSSDAFFEKLGK